MVSVITNFVRAELFTLFIASPDKTPWVTCAKTSLAPESIDVDISNLEMGESVKLSDVNLPEDVNPVITDRDITIASVTAPVEEIEEEIIEEASEEDGEDSVEGEEDQTTDEAETSEDTPEESKEESKE